MPQVLFRPGPWAGAAQGLAQGFERGMRQRTAGQWAEYRRQQELADLAAQFQMEQAAQGISPGAGFYSTDIGRRLAVPQGQVSSVEALAQRAKQEYKRKVEAEQQRALLRSLQVGGGLASQFRPTEPADAPTAVAPLAAQIGLPPEVLAPMVPGPAPPMTGYQAESLDIQRQRLQQQSKRTVADRQQRREAAARQAADRAAALAERREARKGRERTAEGQAEIARARLRVYRSNVGTDKRIDLQRLAGQVRGQYEAALRAQMSMSFAGRPEAEMVVKPSFQAVQGPNGVYDLTTPAGALDYVTDQHMAMGEAGAGIAPRAPGVGVESFEATGPAAEVQGLAERRQQQAAGEQQLRVYRQRFAAAKAMGNANVAAAVIDEMLADLRTQGIDEAQAEAIVRQQLAAPGQ